MDLSIIIVTWQSENEIEPALRSISSCASELKIEVILVDNASTDKTKDKIDKFIAENKNPALTVKTIWNKENKGFAGANNQGLAIAESELFLLLNPDTELVSGNLVSVIKYLGDHPDVGIAGCKLLNMDGSLQPSVRRFPTWKDQALILLKLHNFFPGLVSSYMASDFNYEHEASVDQVRGAYFFLNRGVKEKIGILDDRSFFNWFEEVDYCHRAKNSGYKIMYLPFALCRHAGGASFGQELSFKKQGWFVKSMKQYFRKHGTTTDRVMIYILAPISFVLSWVVHMIKIKPKKYV